MVIDINDKFQGHREGIYLISENSVPEDVLNDIETYLKKLGDSFHKEILPDKGPQASLDWLSPTTVLIIIFAKPFLDTLAKKMAADIYELIKSGISTIWNKFFGPNPKYQYRKYYADGRVEEYFEYSPAFSIYIELVDGNKVKFLYKPIWSQEEFDEATEIYLRNIALHFTGIDNELTPVLKEAVCRARVILVIFDEQTKKMKAIDVVSQQRKHNN